MPLNEDFIRRYAELTVRVGLNVQPGQRVAIDTFVEHAPFVRHVAEEAYAAGASYVDVLYGDQWVRRTHILNADDEHLGWSPPWLVQRFEQLGQDGGARLHIGGNPDPQLFGDLDGARVAGSRMRELSRASLALTDGRCNWSIVDFPTPGWAKLVFGEPDVDRLWDAIATTVRLDEPDPVAAWQEHMANLERRASALNGRRFDALHYRGPGTDLTVGLLPDADWGAAVEESIGIRHVPNMPTEEVFTTPDARRADGVVRSTYPLQIQGTIVRGLEVRFENGCAVELHADEGEELMRTHTSADEGALRLGELALVDSTSRVGQTGLVFYDTLFDENASAHIALGAAIVGAVEGADRLSPEERHARGINHSNIHTDFMIGSPELEVVGVTKGGDEVPILSRGEWVLT